VKCGTETDFINVPKFCVLMICYNPAIVNIATVRNFEVMPTSYKLNVLAGICTSEIMHRNGSLYCNANVELSLYLILITTP
jgi:hypothetical protein